jgi:hypothetical protein
MPAQLEARLRAIEFLIVNLYGIENRRRGWDTNRVVKEHSELLDRMRTERHGAWTGGSPSEVYRQIERLLSDIRTVS